MAVSANEKEYKNHGVMYQPSQIVRLRKLFSKVIEQYENFMKVLDLDVWGLNFRVYSDTEWFTKAKNAVI